MVQTLENWDVPDKYYVSSFYGLWNFSDIRKFNHKDHKGLEFYKFSCQTQLQLKLKLCYGRAGVLVELESWQFKKRYWQFILPFLQQ